MRCILIGGAGFIGTHLAKKLCFLGEDVVSVGRKEIKNSAAKNFLYLKGDCNDTNFLESIIREGDTVIFLAYNSIPKTSFENPTKDIEDNLPLAISIFTAAAKKKIRRLLYISSGGTVYGKTDYHIPIKENAPTNPISPYGISKLAIEKYANFYGEMYQIPFNIIRPANPYGIYQEPFKGQGFISTALASIIKNKEITVYGMHGTIRDYIYIDDLVDGIITILFSNYAHGEIYNIGTGLGYTNFEVLEIIKNSVDWNEKETPINIKAVRNFDVPYNVLDSSLLKNLGWKPTIQLQDGIKITWDWINYFLKIDK